MANPTLIGLQVDVGLEQRWCRYMFLKSLIAGCGQQQ